MRLAYMNAYYHRGVTDGAQAHIGQFVTQAVRLGHEVWMERGGCHPLARPLPVSGVRRVLRLRDMNAIYARLDGTTAGGIRWGAPGYRHLIGRRAVVWEFNTAPEYGSLLGLSEEQVKAMVRLLRGYAPHCDLAVCVSSVLACYVRDLLGISRTVTVPNGSDPELFRPDVPAVRRVQRCPGGLNAVWMGSANLPWHDFDMLIQAAEILWARSERSPISFHVLGPGFRFIGDAPPNVHYYGAADYASLPSWLAAMDVGLCLYRPGPADFGSPLKLFDYMASGLAVIGTVQPQIGEVFDQLGQRDWLLEPGDGKGLADLLERLAADPERVRRHGAAGRRLIVERYNWGRTVGETLDAIEGVVRGQLGQRGR